jgi:hypothetical protein
MLVIKAVPCEGVCSPEFAQADVTLPPVTLDQLAVLRGALVLHASAVAGN